MTIYRRLTIMAIALLVLVTGVLAFTSYTNTIYQRGATDAVQAMNAAREAAESGDVIHGSTAYANFTSDTSTMNPYDHTACDNSSNFKESISIAYTAGAQDARIAIDNNGRGGGCNHNNLPFRGALHQACTHNMGGCGRMHEH